MAVERTLSNETTGTVDTSGMELHELKILKREAGTNNHGVSISRASMCTCATEVCTSVSSGSQNSLVSPESMESAVFHVKRDNTNTFTVLHDQVQSKELDEEVGVVAERLSVKSVEKSMTGTISSSGTTVGLSTLSEFQRLTTESTLVDLSFLCSREWNTEMLELFMVNVRPRIYNYGSIRVPR